MGENLPVGAQDTPLTPVERFLREQGAFTNPPPPPDALTIALTVRDDKGFGCSGGKGQVYLLVMVRFMDCALWATHVGAGSILVVEHGEVTPAFRALRAHIRQGERILFTATGPDTQRALNLCRAIVEGTPEECKRLFRKFHRQLKAAEARRGG